jgi:hypothetical protein
MLCTLIGAISPRTRPREGTRPKPMRNGHNNSKAFTCQEDRRRAQRRQYAPCTKHLWADCQDEFARDTEVRHGGPTVCVTAKDNTLPELARAPRPEEEASGRQTTLAALLPPLLATCLSPLYCDCPS